MVTIRFMGVLVHFTGLTGNLNQPGFFPEFFIAYVTQGIETGLTFFFQWIAAPVQVGHDGVLPLIPRKQKTIAGLSVSPAGIPRRFFLYAPPRCTKVISHAPPPH
jgi:hypothetical protein